MNILPINEWKWRRRTQLLWEYAARGAFLGGCGLLLVHAEHLHQSLSAFGWTLGFLVGALVILGFRTGGRGSLFTRWLFVLLQHPFEVYAATLAGQFLGLRSIGYPKIALAWGIGAVLGVVLGFILMIQARRLRLLGQALWILGMVGAFSVVLFVPLLVIPGDDPTRFVTLLLASLLMGVLLLAGQSEESELEIGLVCLGLLAAFASFPMPMALRALGIIVPVGIYVVYCERVRRGVVGFKFALRGYCQETRGDLRLALVNYRLALARDPQSQLAGRGNWRVHRRIDISRIADDPDLLEMIDPRECLDRARRLLDQLDCTPGQLVEAHQLLKLVETRRSDIPWTLAREHLRLLLAAHQAEDARVYALRLLPVPIDDVLALPDHEAEAVFRIWSLALTAPGLATHGIALLDDPKNLFAFLASLERRSQQWKDDPQVQGFRPFAYGRVTTENLNQLRNQRVGDPLPWFRFDACLELGLAAANAQPPDFTQARELLNVAASGLPERRLDVFTVLKKIDEATGEHTNDWDREILRFADEFGLSNLPERQQKIYFDAVRVLGERAETQGDWNQAIHFFEILVDSVSAGPATLRRLQQLHERRGDILAAIRPVEAALLYNLDAPARKSWLAEKRRLYSQLDPETIGARLETGIRWFDFDFCFDEAHRLFESQQPARDTRHWLHLAALGGAKRRRAVDYMNGRLLLREGQIQPAVQLLQAVCSGTPADLVIPQAERRFFDACRVLADLYLNHTNQPELAIELLRRIERWSGSGADTLFKLGQAYERLGQRKEAKKWYEMVLVYPDHPLADEAREAAYRVDH